MEEQAYKLKKLLKELGSIRGRHTELISVYIPTGFSLNETMNLLSNEISVTQNVKSKPVRKNVISALTKIQQHLKLYKKNPENGLVIFAGNVSQEEGKSDIKLWAIEPPESLGIKLYWCDQKFDLTPLEDMIKEKDVYGLLVMDNKEATIAVLRGKRIDVVRHFESIIPGKTGKGGQSAQRFERVREGLKHDFYKKVAEEVRGSLPEDIKGIIIGGPGPVKNHFVDSDFLSIDLKNKVLGVKDVGYTDEHGLEELVNKSQDLLAEASVAKEKILVQKFFTELYKDTGMVTYGLDPVIKALQMGAIETLLLSEDIDLLEGEFQCNCGFSEKKFVKSMDQKCPKCGNKLGVVGQRDALEAFEDMVKEFRTSIEIISRDTREGEQLANLGGIAAILRYKL